MENRSKAIQKWIDAGKERDEITRCIFYITVPKDINISEDKTIKKVKKILRRNHVGHGHVDTVCGAWNLNRQWLETDGMDCIVEYCGVYPIDWKTDDIVELERMEARGEILVLVYVKEDGQWTPNH